jgi:NAD(P)-dependent dehydrogenase (short-subunit alcohol dehydrogenase family)
MSRVAVVTGGGRGIGRAIAARFAAEGDAVAVLDADPERAGAAPGALHLAVDVSDERAVADAVHEVEAHLGPVNVLVNNVGVTSQEPLPFEELSLAAWRRVIDVNLTGTFLVTRAVGQSMIARGVGGVVVSIASMYGSRAMDWRLYDHGPEPRRQDEAAYHVSKAGVIQLTQVLATSWAPYGIRVSCVSPGPVDTEFVRETLGAGETTRISSRTPVGRFALPEEIAACVRFLASDDASYVTGANLLADGGWTCW